jgi:hypothetical protein
MRRNFGFNVKYTINVDFDGTCVTHKYPFIGEDIGAVPVLQRLAAHGHQLILFTMRSSQPVMMADGSMFTTGLSDAVEWFERNEIPLYGIQVNPTQHHWTSSPKSHADIMIDDSALGCPLIYPNGDRPYVDWVRVEKMLEEDGLFDIF